MGNMISIPISDLRELHYDSDQLRAIFFDMECSEGGGTEFIPKENISDKELEYAKKYVLNINKKIIDLDVETPNNRIIKVLGETLGYSLIELLGDYYKEYDCIIECDNNRIVVQKDMLIAYDSNEQLLYYYADDNPESVPLGAIVISSITAIKRSG